MSNVISQFKAYCQHLQDTIQPLPNQLAINKNKVVLDDSALTKYLSDMSEDDNHFLAGVMPSFGSSGTDVDNHQFKGYTQLLILKKTSYSERDYDEFLEIFEQAFDVVTDVVNKMKSDHASGKCVFLRYLNVTSLQILPVWNKSGCNGWNILFNFDNTF